MDSEVREHSKIADYNPDVLEDALERDIRDLVAFLITQAEGTGQPVAVHAYTDSVHLGETLRARLKSFVPDRYAKALDHFIERLEEISTSIYSREHPDAIIRVVLNIARDPITGSLIAGSPAAYADGNIETSTLRHRTALAKDIWGIDPELRRLPPGFLFIAQPAFEDPVDRQEALNKQGGNLFMYNEKELNEMAELRAEQMRRLMPYSGIEPVSRAHSPAGEETAEAETWLERQNRENKEFFKRREETDRTNRAREQNEKFFDRQRDQAKQDFEAQDRNAKAFEDRKGANENLAERQRAGGEHFRRSQEGDAAAAENTARSNEAFYRRQDDQEARRQAQEAQALAFEMIEADNALAEAIARLEATFGLIYEREEEISRAPHAASELSVLGGEVGGLRGLLAGGRGNAALRARASIDVQRAAELGAEFRRLGHEAAARELESVVAAAETGAAEVSAAEAGVTAETGAETAVATAGAAVAGAALEAGGEGAGEQAGPAAAEIAEAVAEITGAGQPIAAGEQVPAGETPAVIEPTVEAAETEAQGAAVPEAENPEIVESTAEVPETEARGAVAPEEEVPATAEPAETGAEPGSQPSEQRGPSIVRDEIEERMIGAVQEEAARPIQEMQPAPPPTREGEVAGTAAGAGEVPQRPPAREEGEGTEAETEPETESEPQPSERKGADVIRKVIEEKMVGAVKEGIARLVQEMQPAPPIQGKGTAPAKGSSETPKQPPAAEATGATERKSAAETKRPPAKENRPAAETKTAARAQGAPVKATRAAEAELERARATRERTDAKTGRNGRAREGLRQLQEETGPQAQTEESEPQDIKRRKTDSEKMGGGSSGRRQAKQADLEKAAENAVRENHVAEAARETMIKEMLEMKSQEAQTQDDKKTAQPLQPPQPTQSSHPIEKTSVPPQKKMESVTPAAQAVQPARQKAPAAKPATGTIARGPATQPQKKRAAAQTQKPAARATVPSTQTHAVQRPAAAKIRQPQQAARVSTASPHKGSGQSIPKPRRAVQSRAIRNRAQTPASETHRIPAKVPASRTARHQQADNSKTPPQNLSSRRGTPPQKTSAPAAPEQNAQPAARRSSRGGRSGGSKPPARKPASLNAMGRKHGRSNSLPKSQRPGSMFNPSPDPE